MVIVDGEVTWHYRAYITPLYIDRVGHNDKRFNSIQFNSIQFNSIQIDYQREKEKRNYK